MQYLVSAKIVTLIGFVLFLPAGFLYADSDCETPLEKQVAALQQTVAAAPSACIEVEAHKINKKHPEEAMKEAASALSDEEIFARLVFAESLASRCLGKGQDSALIEGIAWALFNRVKDAKKRYGDGRNVVFKKMAFRSTFSVGYEGTTWEEFLCPSSVKEHWGEHWQQSQEAVERIFSGEVDNPMPQVRHYYLGQHFKGTRLEKKWMGVRPRWAKPPHERVHPELKGLNHESSCIEFYNVHE